MGFPVIARLGWKDGGSVLSWEGTGGIVGGVSIDKTTMSEECARLDRRWGRPGRVEFRSSAIGPVARLAAPGGTAEVALLGAQTVSWGPAGGSEVLCRPGGEAKIGEEIHGGIPVCWPWFGRMGPDGSRLHGMARYCRFEVAAVEATGERTEVVLRLEASKNTRKAFPHGFRLDVRIGVGEALEVSMEAANTGAEAFAVTAGFHPYLRVSGADRVWVEGVDGARYLDWTADTDGREDHDLQTGAYRPVLGSRVFADARPVCRLRDAGLGRAIVLEAAGHTRWCVWRADAGRLPRGNLLPEDASGFVCVEPVVFPRCDAVVVEPVGRQTMSLKLRTEV